MYTSPPDGTTPHEIMLRQGGVADIDAMLPLLVAYRRFYGLESDTAALRPYLHARLQQSEASLWLALHHGDVIAFALCYHGHSTLTLQRNDLLHDLYVAPAWRRHGVAARLLQSIQYALPPGATLWLETAHDNLPAQALYRRLGFVRDEVFLTMAWQRPADL